MASEALRGPDSNTVQFSNTPISAEKALARRPELSIIPRNHLSLVPQPLAEKIDDEHIVAADAEETLKLKRYAQTEIHGKIPQSFYFRRTGILGKFDATVETIGASVEFVGSMGQVFVMYTAVEIARTGPVKRALGQIAKYVEFLGD